VIKRNVIVGLLLLVVALLFGMAMATISEFPSVQSWLRLHLREGRTVSTLLNRDLMLSHAQWGVLGLANLAIGFVLLRSAWGPRGKSLLSWMGVLGGALVPLGFFMEIFADPLKYARAIGTLLLLASLMGTAWGLRDVSLGPPLDSESR
jgi:hypothetical protein